MQRILKTTFMFAIALVFTAGMAFGQDHQADIDQVGNDNNSDVTQQSNNGPSEAYVSQNGNLNTTTLEQIEFGFGGHFADIEQTGSRNVVDARTQGHQHDLYIDQSGQRNRADVQTLNLGDNIDIDQTGARNFADVYLWPGGNDATVFQDGNRNSANISYEGQNTNPSFDGMDLRVYQDGSRNVGNINVDFTISQGTIGGKADIVQLGNDNRAYIDQFDGVNTAEIRQDGNGNFANVDQGF